jgi:hypothetical protein
MSEQPYKIVIPGVDGGGAQVFEANTQEELVEKLRTAQENATAKIRELAQTNEALASQINNNSPNGGEEVPYDKQQFFSNLYQNPDDAIIGVLERKMGMKFDDFQRDYQNTRLGSQKAIQNEVSAVFAQRHPELLQVSTDEDKQNAETLSKILADNQWNFNINNLEAAYALARTQGKLKLPTDSGYAEVRMPPAPSSMTRPTGAVNSSESLQEFFNKGSIAEIRKYFETGPGSK